MSTLLLAEDQRRCTKKNCTCLIRLPYNQEMKGSSKSCVIVEVLTSVPEDYVILLN